MELLKCCKQSQLNEGPALTYWRVVKIGLAVVSVNLTVALAMVVDGNFILEELGAALILTGTMLSALAGANITFVV
jgi:hypothetical protein